MTRTSSAARRSDRDDAPVEFVSSPRSPNTNKPRLAPTAVYAGTSAGPSAFPMRKPATAPRTLPPSARLSTRARRSDAAAIPMHAAAQMAKMITNEAEDAPDIQRRMPCRRYGPIAAAHHRHRKATSPPSAARNWLERGHRTRWRVLASHAGSGYDDLRSKGTTGRSTVVSSIGCWRMWAAANSASSRASIARASARSMLNLQASSYIARPFHCSAVKRVVSIAGRSGSAGWVKEFLSWRHLERTPWDERFNAPPQRGPTASPPDVAGRLATPRRGGSHDDERSVHRGRVDACVPRAIRCGHGDHDRRPGRTDRDLEGRDGDDPCRDGAAEP